jgi:hypothetical protein
MQASPCCLHVHRCSRSEHDHSRMLLICHSQAAVVVIYLGLYPVSRLLIRIACSAQVRHRFVAQLVRHLKVYSKVSQLQRTKVSLPANAGRTVPKHKLNKYSQHEMATTGRACLAQLKSLVMLTCVHNLHVADVHPVVRQPDLRRPESSQISEHPACTKQVKRQVYMMLQHMIEAGWALTACCCRSVRCTS